MGRLSGGGFARTLFLLGALAVYAGAGWLTWKGRSLIQETGAIPHDPMAVLSGPAEPIVGSLVLVGAILTVHVAGGLTCIAMSFHGEAGFPLVPEPSYSKKQRRRLRIGGLLVGGLPPVAAAIVVVPIVTGSGIHGLGPGTLASLLLLLVYVGGVAMVLSVLLPPVDGDWDAAVAIFTLPTLLLVEFALRSGLEARASSAIVTGVAVLFGAGVLLAGFQGLADRIPQLETRANRWAIFGGSSLAVVVAWSLGGLVLPPLSRPLSVILVTATIPLLVVVQGYVTG